MDTEKPVRIPRPERFTEFADLATRLYNQPDCSTGGPLHVELEDHNTDLLVGSSGERVASEIAAALAMVDAVDIPAEPMRFNADNGGWPEGTAEHNMAHYYGAHPETLRIAAAILAITIPWSEEEAAAAYAQWAEQANGGACRCEVYPEFLEADPDVPPVIPGSAFQLEAWTGANRVVFTPLDENGCPDLAKATYATARSIEVTCTPEATGDFTGVQEAMQGLGNSLREFSIELTDMSHRAFADLYKALTGRPLRTTKDRRRFAKRRKLDQRRAARAAAVGPGADYRAAMPLWRHDIGAIARGLKTRKTNDRKGSK